MRPVVYIGAAGLVAAGVAGYLWTSSQPQAKLAANWEMIDRYCVDCHNDGEFTAGLTLEGRSPEEVAADAAVWEKAIHKLHLGLMPPRGEPRPDPEVQAEFVAALETTLDTAAREQPYAGVTDVHRLNRAEYTNAIRDLLGVEADIEKMLPSDGGDFGFDNIADALTTSPMLLERYLTVALRVADMAIGNPEAVMSATTYPIPMEVTQDYHLEGMPLGTRGGIAVTHTFPADAEYVLSGRLIRGVEEGLFGIEGHDIPHEFLILVDGEQVYSAEIGGKEDHELSVEEGINVAQTVIEGKLTSPPVPITAGPHEVIFTWRERPAREQNAWEPALRASLEIHNPSGMPRLEMGVIEGPINATGVSDTPSRNLIFTCRPESEAEEAPCAEQILSKLARRAFRRPVTEEDISAAMAFYEQERQSGGDFDSGIHAAVTRILVSPFFLFRVEKENPDVPPGGTHPIDDFELASRLSFFLWSSIPDEELLGLAEQGRLRDAEVLEQQVLRMIADERSQAFVENFTGQWLQLRNLEQRVKPDLLAFPDFDHNLRMAFRRETQMLFDHVLRENRPVHELLTADYTFANERLARHYGIEGVYGSRYRLVEVEDPNRYGLLGHGSILSLTGAGASPIIRGKFIMTEMLNSPPPAPPANVPNLEESAPEGRPSTVREQLELHRESPNCSVCHNVIDPPGFALENFDEVGRWRDVTEDGLEIDTAGVLADGTEIDGPAALREALLKRPET
ncbi:MAG: DUF1592 domain-containing protein, partial [Gammaproteobacteria bacterium]|nr:DUF1592 domain-containing protein [Gammaproteobacteria bacterium]